MSTYLEIGKGMNEIEAELDFYKEVERKFGVGSSDIEIVYGIYSKDERTYKAKFTFVDKRSRKLRESRERALSIIKNLRDCGLLTIDTIVDRILEESNIDRKTLLSSRSTYAVYLRMGASYLYRSLGLSYSSIAGLTSLNQDPLDHSTVYLNVKRMKSRLDNERPIEDTNTISPYLTHTLDVVSRIRRDETVTIENLEDRLLQEYGLNVTRNDLIGPSRRQIIVTAREALYYLYKAKFGLSYEKIGNRIGGRHYTTIMSGARRISKLLEQYEGHKNGDHKQRLASTDRSKKSDSVSDPKPKDKESPKIKPYQSRVLRVVCSIRDDPSITRDNLENRLIQECGLIVNKRKLRAGSMSNPLYFLKQCTFYLYREKFSLGYHKIGQIMGGAYNNVVKNGVKKISKLLEQYEESTSSSAS